MPTTRSSTSIRNGTESSGVRKGAPVGGDAGGISSSMRCACSVGTDDASAQQAGRQKAQREALSTELRGARDNFQIIDLERPARGSRARPVMRTAPSVSSSASRASQFAPDSVPSIQAVRPSSANATTRTKLPIQRSDHRSGPSVTCRRQSSGASLSVGNAMSTRTGPSGEYQRMPAPDAGLQVQVREAVEGVAGVDERRHRPVAPDALVELDAADELCGCRRRRCRHHPSGRGSRSRSRARCSHRRRSSAPRRAACSNSSFAVAPASPRSSTRPPFQTG